MYTGLPGFSQIVHYTPRDAQAHASSFRHEITPAVRATDYHGLGDGLRDGA